MPDDLVLVRVVRGQVGPVTPEDGYLVTLPADQAAELVVCGEAVAVAEDILNRPALPTSTGRGPDTLGGRAR